MEMFNPPITYAVKHKDEIIREKSRSGGAFSAISDVVLNNNGVVYGCIMTDKYTASHVRAETFEQRDFMRGSKYIESKLGDTFALVKSDILKGRSVLFSGTPCQVDGLKCFLGALADNVITIDIVCHGVPSPTVWKKYIEWREEKYGSCTYADFRNKVDFGWASHVESLIMENNGKVKKVDSRVFTNIFYSHLALRPSCYKCAYKRVEHPGDITIADYWAIDNALPGFNDNKGVSLVMINSSKGKMVFEKAKEMLVFHDTDYHRSTRPTMFKPPEKPVNRNEFWMDFATQDFSFMEKKYGNNSFLTKCKFFIKNKGKVII